MRICSLCRKMEHEAALRKLSPSGVRRWWIGKLRGIAEIYLPYRLYKVILQDRGRETISYYAIDAITGTLDPYEFATLPESEAWSEVETGNVHPAKLHESQTRQRLTEKIQRRMYSQGFFRLRNPRIIAELIKPEFYIPYWMGFYGDERNVSVSVIDAVRQTVEGSKARQIVKMWLLDPTEEPVVNSGGR